MNHFDGNPFLRDLIELNSRRCNGCYKPLIVPRGEATHMAYYRLYFMDPRSGHIAAFEAIDAADDSQALAEAEKHLGWQPLELWCERRKVRRFEAATLSPR